MYLCLIWILFILLTTKPDGILDSLKQFIFLSTFIYLFIYLFRSLLFGASHVFSPFIAFTAKAAVEKRSPGITVYYRFFNLHGDIPVPARGLVRAVNYRRPLL